MDDDDPDNESSSTIPPDYENQSPNLETKPVQTLTQPLVPADPRMTIRTRPRYDRFPVLNEEDLEFFNSFPPGYRFCPKDEELITCYLKLKVHDRPLPRNRIISLDLYKYNPEVLAAVYSKYGENEWYFFTPRDKKYLNGTRPNRAAGDGYWKATGADKSIIQRNVIVGFRKALVFYRGRPPKGDKTNWIMHEFRVTDPPPPRSGILTITDGVADKSNKNMRLDDSVLCRIYKKSEKPVRSRNNNRSEEADMVVNKEVDQNRTADIIGIETDFNAAPPDNRLSQFASITYPIDDQFMHDAPSDPYLGVDDQLTLTSFGGDTAFDFPSSYGGDSYLCDGYSATMVPPSHMNRFHKETYFNSELPLDDWYHNLDVSHPGLDILPKNPSNHPSLSSSSLPPQVNPSQSLDAAQSSQNNHNSMPKQQRKRQQDRSSRDF